MCSRTGGAKNGCGAVVMCFDRLRWWWGWGVDGWKVSRSRLAKIYTIVAVEREISQTRKALVLQVMRLLSRGAQLRRRCVPFLEMSGEGSIAARPKVSSKGTRGRWSVSLPQALWGFGVAVEVVRADRSRR